MNAGSVRRAEGDVAMFIDWENLKLSLEKLGYTSPNLSTIVETAREFGRLVVARAYADFTQQELRLDARNLYQAGIDPVYVPGSRMGNLATFKNSADIRLAVDAVAMSSSLPNASTFVIVTGDGDLIHLINQLRLSGTSVIVVGVGFSMNARLASSADQTLLYEQDIEPRGRPVEIASPPAGAEKLETVYAWITSLARQARAGDRYPLTRLGTDLRERYSFVAKDSGFGSLKQIVEGAQAQGLLTVSTIAGQDYVSLPDSDANPDELPVSSVLDDVLIDGDDVTLHWLSTLERQQLIQFLEELERTSHYLTFSFIVKQGVSRSVVQRLSERQMISVMNDLIKTGVLRKEFRTGVRPDNPEAEMPIIRLNHQHPMLRTILDPIEEPEVDGRPDPFEALPDALVEAQNLTFPAVQAALENRLGMKLRQLGFPKASEFFQRASERGLARIEQLPNDTWVVVGIDDPPVAEHPGLANLLTGAEVEHLGAEGIDLALRVLATVEDRAGGRLVQNGSLIRHLISGIALNGGPRLTSGRATRLLRRELVLNGYVRAIPVEVLDPTTGLPRRIPVYQLVRDHPVAQRAISHGPVQLDENIETRLMDYLRRVDTGEPPAQGDLRAAASARESGLAIDSIRQV